MAHQRKVHIKKALGIHHKESSEGCVWVKIVFFINQESDVVYRLKTFSLEVFLSGNQTKGFITKREEEFEKIKQCIHFGQNIFFFDSTTRSSSFFLRRTFDFRKTSSLKTRL